MSSSGSSILNLLSRSSDSTFESDNSDFDGVRVRSLKMYFIVRLDRIFPERKLLSNLPIGKKYVHLKQALVMNQSPGNYSVIYLLESSDVNLKKALVMNPSP